MWKAYSPFIQPHRLQESLHPYDTQLNESLNQKVSKYAPKTKCFSTSMALTYRISIAIGVHNLGHLRFWEEVFSDLGIDMSINLRNYLFRKDKAKENKKEYQSRPERKRKRNQEKFDKIQEDLKKLKKDKKRGATYGSGIGIKNSVPPEVERIDYEKKKTSQCECSLLGCYNKGHKRRSSKKCFYFTCSSKEELNDKINSNLRRLYPSHYGE